MTKNDKQKVIAVLGKTATGKSGLSIELAKKINGEVISADSRQVYKGLNLGTGKVTGKEMMGIKHHLLDVINPKNQFSVSQYKTITDKTIGEIISRGKVPILCGGTGLYLDAVINNVLLPEVPPNEILRKKLDNKSANELYSILKKLDPKRAETIDAKNPRRLIRAIEIATAFGKVPNLAVRPPSWNVLKIGINLSDNTLKEKIHIRLLERVKKGMITEAKRLHTKGLSWKRMEALGLEYKYLALYLQKKITKQEMLSKLETEIWRYSKRQGTWFKRDKNIKWFKPSEFKKIEKETEKFLKK